MIVSFGLFNAPNNHPLSQMECQECIQRETKRDISQIQKTRSFFSTPYPIASCPSPLILPSISLFSLHSHHPLLSPPPFLPPLWVSDTQGIVCVHVLLRTSRMLLLGGIPSAPDYVARDGPQEGMGKKKSYGPSEQHTHIYILYPKQTHTCLLQAKANSLMHASKNHDYSLGMDKSTELGTTEQSKFPLMPDIYAKAIKSQK